MKWLITLLLIGHSAITVWAMEQHSFWDFFPPFQERLTTQIFSDLTIAMGLVLGFFYLERKSQARPMLPWYGCALATLLLGSFAPLIYLLLGGYRPPLAK